MIICKRGKKIFARHDLPSFWRSKIKIKAPIFMGKINWKRSNKEMNIYDTYKRKVCKQNKCDLINKN